MEIVRLRGAGVWGGGFPGTGLGLPPSTAEWTVSWSGRKLTGALDTHSTHSACSFPAETSWHYDSCYSVHVGSGWPHT